MPAEHWKGLHGQSAVVFRPPTQQSGDAITAFVRDLQAHNEAGGCVVVPDSAGYPRSDGRQSRKERMVWAAGGGQDATTALLGKLESKGEKVLPEALEGTELTLLLRALMVVLPVESKLALLQEGGKAKLSTELRALNKVPIFEQHTEEQTSGCCFCRKTSTVTRYSEKVRSLEAYYVVKC
jgi:hypothetical protein